MGVLVLALLAGGMTEATLAIGHRGSINDDTKERPAHSSAATSSPKATPKPSMPVTPAVTATPTPAATPTPGPTVTTNSFVHMRADKSTSSQIIANLDGGTVLQELPDSDSQWQQVMYNGTKGYVYK
jgi:uncharacterized protein YgiM (DUF1202 family)